MLCFKLSPFIFILPIRIIHLLSLLFPPADAHTFYVTIADLRCYRTSLVSFLAYAALRFFQASVSAQRELLRDHTLSLELSRAIGVSIPETSDSFTCESGSNPLKSPSLLPTAHGSSLPTLEKLLAKARHSTTLQQG